MAQLDAQQPSKIYRGTVDEVFSHRSEIPHGATVELKVFEEQPTADADIGDFGGKSLADLIREIESLAAARLIWPRILKSICKALVKPETAGRSNHDA